MTENLKKTKLVMITWWILFGSKLLLFFRCLKSQIWNTTGSLYLLKCLGLDCYTKLNLCIDKLYKGTRSGEVARQEVFCFTRSFSQISEDVHHRFFFILFLVGNTETGYRHDKCVCCELWILIYNFRWNGRWRVIVLYTFCCWLKEIVVVTGRR